MGEPRVAVIVRYGLNPDAWRERHAAGEVVDATPYGYDLADGDVSLEWSRDHAEAAPARWMRHGVRRALGFDFVHVWRNRDVIRRADAVWTHTEREHLAVALLSSIRRRRYAALSVAQTVWMWDEWHRYSRARRAVYRRLLHRHAVEVVHSRVNRDISDEAVPGRRVLRVPFGTHLAPVSTPPGPRTGAPRVLVVGNDRHRDWALLSEVASLVPEAAFTIVTLSPAVQSIDWPSNVTITSMTQADIINRAYAESSIVAVPLLANAHVSGCTVTIEGMSAGLPVVATDTGGNDEYLAGSTSTLVPVGDAAAFAAALRTALDSPAETPDPSVAARRGLSQRDYVARFVAITRALLADAPIDPSVETFAPMHLHAVREGEAR
ncbi:glycosyltransferase [uncultured Demequina sp.]|uniref:glycosyltransferase n=1 Tax=uncultured Demequina sp. TaxID=693499 RepID=UPI0025F128AA|nr:glycosyltransferase [uncultured Demequina sp.]